MINNSIQDAFGSLARWVNEELVRIPGLDAVSLHPSFPTLIQTHVQN